MARVANFGGVTFYDDSKGTNVGASVTALLGLSEARGVLIAGGRDKQGAYDSLVSALEANGQPWAQSNYGSFVALAAPGTAIMPTGDALGGFAGTSIASAYTAHIVAVYRASHPQATSTDSRTALLGALSPAVTDANGHNYGAGVLDAAAVQRLLH